MHGVIPKKDGTLYSKPYVQLLDEVVNSQDAELLRHFILTVGVVSNHGNWFTSGNPNKELRVLAQSYDWLLFLTDDGLAEFIADILQSHAAAVAPAKAAFLASYSARKKENRFTKVQMALDADKALQDYFARNIRRIEKWFNVISPTRGSIEALKSQINVCQINVLSRKDWESILKP
jgi:GT2 family glycosyltransferase